MRVDDKDEAEEQPAANKPPEPSEQHHDKQSDIRGGAVTTAAARLSELLLGLNRENKPPFYGCRLVLVTAPEVRVKFPCSGFRMIL